MIVKLIMRIKVARSTMKSDWRGKSLFELSQDLFLTRHLNDNTRDDAVLDLFLVLNLE